MKLYVQGNEDNIDKAVQGLDQFTKNWCMNCAETIEHEEPVFRCYQCEFHEGEKCRIKQFVNRHEHRYPLDKFGCMSR